MGLLQQLVELFAGTRDRKPDLRKFRKALEEAMADGILTDQEIDDLEKIKKQLKLSDAEIAKFKRKAYEIAHKVSFGKGVYNARKEKELDRIQRYLGLPDAAVRRYKDQLRRMRLLAEVREGKLPVVDVAGLEFSKGERPHFTAQAHLLDDEDHEGSDSPDLIAAATVGNAPCRVEEPLPELRVTSTGRLIATNRRFLFNGPNKTFNLTYDQVLGLIHHPDGLRVIAEAGKSKRLRWAEKQDAEVAAELLTRAVAAR